VRKGLQHVLKILADGVVHFRVPKDQTLYVLLLLKLESKHEGGG
jgi:hypothetical protein